MPDETTPPAVDPLTQMSMEIDALKGQLADAKKQVDTANQNVAMVINANKALMAELTKCDGDACAIGAPARPAAKPSADKSAITAFYGELGIKKD